MALTVAKTKKVVFISLLMCFLGASLLATAFATEYWFVSDSKWTFLEGQVSGNVNFGLFKGINAFTVNEARTHTLHVVCLKDVCMYSCADTKEHREEQLQMLLDKEDTGLLDHCERKSSSRSAKVVDPTQIQLMQDVDNVRKTHFWSLLSPPFYPVGVVAHRLESDHMEQDDFLEESEVTNTSVTSNTLDNTTTTNPTNTPEDLEYMDYGLWVGTIACLSGGLLMAVVGALFAIVNTATTPVEAITGIPGLYLWNSLAAIFDMLTVILWAVQFHKHLTDNVLLYDANDGWTTKGMEVFGYSFWLVVVAIFVHIANIVIIALGTYEPKKKDHLQAPETKGGNIMLY